MKTQFENILKILGYNYKYVSNFDDITEGFESNPTPNVLIRVKFTFQDGYERKMQDFESNVCIEKFVINTFDKTVSYAKLINGRAICLLSGLVDYPFYHQLLKNWDSFR